MKTVEQMIAVMTAYKEGKEIQFSNIARPNWTDIGDPHWDWSCFDYRVKPEPKLRPYVNAKEFVDAMREHGPMMTDNLSSHHILPTDVFSTSIWIGHVGNTISMEECANKYYWQDGTPCGIEERDKE